MIVLKLAICMALLTIAYQDYKDRMVFWFLYPIVGLLGFFIQKKYGLLWTVVAFNTIVNLIFISIMLAILWMYTKLILKKKLINEAIGIGDILFFVFLSFCFPIVTFVFMFVMALIFSLGIHLIFSKDKKETIPLAGYMAVFFLIGYGLSFFVNCHVIFAL
jgi:hypothetical protein